MSELVTNHVVVMGVSGCGKTTVAERLSEELSLPLAEADAFHPPANIEKMSHGTPLTDEDRYPWLRELNAWMAAQAAGGRATVMACSALRRKYRDILRDGLPSVGFIHLAGPMEVIAERLSAREGHFMRPELLQSQFDTLEQLAEDELGVALDLRQTPDQLVAASIAWLRGE